MTHLVTLTKDHVSNPRLLGRWAFAIQNAIGKIQPVDAGKRVHLVRPDMVQVENDQQRKGRQHSEIHQMLRAEYGPRSSDDTSTFFVVNSIIEHGDAYVVMFWHQYPSVGHHLKTGQFRVAGFYRMGEVRKLFDMIAG